MSLSVIGDNLSGSNLGERGQQSSLVSPFVLQRRGDAVLGIESLVRRAADTHKSVSPYSEGAGYQPAARPAQPRNRAIEDHVAAIHQQLARAVLETGRTEREVFDQLPKMP